jgi:hypothetical protein
VVIGTLFKGFFVPPKSQSLVVLDGFLDFSARQHTFLYMSYKLAKPRTVRFSLEVDKRLSAVAARKGKSVSEVIRDSVMHDLEAGDQTAGDWLLTVAKSPLPSRKLNDDFIRAYRKRHS